MTKAKDNDEGEKEDPNRRSERTYKSKFSQCDRTAICSVADSDVPNIPGCATCAVTMDVERVNTAQFWQRLYLIFIFVPPVHTPNQRTTPDYSIASSFLT